MKHAAFRLVSCALALLAATEPVFAETTDCGAYTVHHIAVNSTFIQPEIAE